jgi:mono/diheme cytochrome c family protein
VNLRSISFLARSVMLVGSLTAFACDKGGADEKKADDKKADAKAADAKDDKADEVKADEAKAEAKAEDGTDAKADGATGDAKADDAAGAEGADETGAAADDSKADAKADDAKADAKADDVKADPKSDDKKADDKKADDKKADDKKPEDTKTDDKSAKIDAKDLFGKKCKSCHGATGDAKTKLGEKHAIPDWTQPGWKAKWPKPKVVAIIADGEPGTKMKGFKDKLSKDEIDALADYSRKLGK